MALVKNIASTYDKKKGNFERQRVIMDMRSVSAGIKVSDRDYLRKININRGLFNGKIDTAMYEDEICYIIGKEEFKLPSNSIVHFPIISQVVHAKLGEFISKPFIVTVKDNSPTAQTFVEKEFNKLLSQYIQLNIIKPMEEAFMSQAKASLGIEEISQLPQEQQQQFQQQVQSQVQAMTPEEILDYIENDYKTPVSKQMQEITNYLIDELEIKEKTDEGARELLIAAEEYFYVGIRNNDIVYEMVQPEELEYGGSKGTEWVQDMRWVKRITYRDVEDVLQDFALDLTNKNIDELYKLVTPTSGSPYYDRDNSQITKTIMYELSENGEKWKQELGNLDYKTKEGGDNMLSIWGRLQNEYGKNAKMTDFCIPVEHHVWKDKVYKYLVERWDEDQQAVIKHWFADNYESIESDLKVTRILVDEIWEGYKLGTGSPIYLKIRRLPYQDYSLNNPFKKELPYYGKAVNTQRNRQKNVSSIDFGKAYQREYDIEMAAMMHDQKTNLGKIILFVKNMKPEGTSWKDWYTTIKDLGIAEIDVNKKGVNPADHQLIKELNLSKVQDIAARYAKCESLKSEIYAAMFSSGQAGQYATNGNIQSQQGQVFLQNEPLAEAHRKIVEKSLNGLVNLARLFYKENIEKIKHILSPSSLMELEAGNAFFYGTYGIRLENTGREAREVEAMKARMQDLLQNEAGVDVVFELGQAASKGDLKAIARRWSKNLDKSRQASQEAQAAENQRKEELMLRIKDMDNAFEMEKLKFNADVSIHRSEIQADSFRRANDVNQDNINDNTKNKEMQIQADLVQHEDKIALEYAKIGKTPPR